MQTSVPFDTSVELLIYAFIALASLCIGLSTTLANVTAILGDSRVVGRALTANILLPPVLAGLIIAAFPLEPAAQTVLLLLAFAPGGINAVQFSTKVPGQIASAGALLLLLSAVSLVTAPLAALTLLPPSAEVSVPLGEVAMRALGLIALPAMAGVALRRSSPELAEKLYKPVMLASLLAFIASVVLSTEARQQGLAQLGSSTTVAILIFIVALMAVGWLLGGPDTGGRQVLAVSTNLRNVGLVYVLVDGCCDDTLMEAAVLGFMALMVLPNLALTVGCAVWRKRHLTQ
jgi:BASS family bile acid:Na+ symporter